MQKEHYRFEIPKEGSKGVLILDYLFNPTSQIFIEAAGIKPGMRVLEIGCGSGVMACWLSQQVAPDGSIFAIDNNENQLKAAKHYAATQNIKNIEFKVCSAYDIAQLNEKFDFVFHRFVLHHLREPDQVIQNIYDVLNDNGTYVAEEGIMAAGFSYPDSIAFQAPPTQPEGHMPDNNIGRKMYYKLYQAGFNNLKAKLVSPLLITKEEKELLLPGLLEFKKTFLESVGTEEEWQHKYDETIKLINNDTQIVGHYQSCQVSGVKTK